MKILLIGNFGAGNVGDELILRSALQTYPGSIVMTEDRQRTQAFLGEKVETVFTFPTGIRSLIRLLVDDVYRKQIFDLKHKVNKVIFPGGGLFAIKFHAYLVWWWRALWCRMLFGKNIQIRYECQGVDKPINFLTRWMTRWALGRASYISVRDTDSAQALQSIGIMNVIQGKDRVEGSLDQAKKHNHTKPHILLNARYKISGSKWKNLQKKYPEAQWTFVAFDPSDLGQVPVGFTGNSVYPETITALTDVVSRADVMIGERLHSLIVGAEILGHHQTYLLRRPYAQKVKTWAESYGVREY